MLARQLSRHDIQYCKPSTASLRDSSLFEIVSVSVRFHLLSLNLYILMVCEIRAEQELPNVNCPWLYVEVTFLLHQDHIFFFHKHVKRKKGKRNNSLAEDDEKHSGENSLYSQISRDIFYLLFHIFVFLHLYVVTEP